MSRGHRDGVVVDILDRKYTFACSDDTPREHIAEVASLVDEHLRQAQSAHGTTTTLRTAIITALELVDELFRLRETYESAESDIATRTSRLTSNLGKLLEEVGPRWQEEETIAENRAGSPDPEQEQG